MKTKLIVQRHKRESNLFADRVAAQPISDTNDLFCSMMGLELRAILRIQSIGVKQL